jgi:hypothetical protein
MRGTKLFAAVLVAAAALMLSGCPWNPEDDGDGDNGDDWSDWTPVEVEGLYAVAGNGAVLLSWWEPNGSFDHVEVSWTPGGEAGEDVNPFDSSHLVSDLTNGVTYTFTVRVFGDEESASDGVTATCMPTAQFLYGGSGTDEGRSVTRNSGGEYVVAGSTQSAELQDALNVGAPDVYVLRIGIDGVVADWVAYGSLNDEIARDIALTSDDDYLLAGDWEVIDGHGDNFLALRLSTTFARVFERAPGGNGHEQSEACLETTDGGFAFAGESHSADIPDTTYNLNGDAYVVKLDSDGNLDWQVLFGGTGWDRLHGMIERSDGTLVVVGSSYSSNLPGSTQDGIDDFYLAELDADGVLQWQKMYGGTWQDSLSAIDETADGGSIVAGYSTSSDLTGLLADNGSGYVAKLDASGDVVWHTRVGGDGAWLTGVTALAGGHYAVAGYGPAPGEHWELGYQGYLAELSSTGTVVRECHVGGTETEYLGHVLETPAGGFVAVGYSDSADIPGTTNAGGTDVYVVMVEAE